MGVVAAVGDALAGVLLVVALPVVVLVDFDLELPQAASVSVDSAIASAPHSVS